MPRPPLGHVGRLRCCNGRDYRGGLPCQALSAHATEVCPSPPPPIGVGGRSGHWHVKVMTGVLGAWRNTQARVGLHGVHCPSRLGRRWGLNTVVPSRGKSGRRWHGTISPARSIVSCGLRRLLRMTQTTYNRPALQSRQPCCRPVRSSHGCCASGTQRLLLTQATFASCPVQTCSLLHRVPASWTGVTCHITRLCNPGPVTPPGVP